ncbi:MAG: oxidative damage protection protein [Gammaproteobacteria bacterium]|nr:MAG: oxidative damage protection protein [Gammaproteobacteria bacterium]|tara:strand:- start:315 stop:584 length:270 start_codon:yes stop_codon:yes gene_type:complete
MTRTVFCKKYKEELEGLISAPFPGEKGEEILNNVSKRAWEDWLEHQKMLINEGQMNLADRESRKWLNEQMELFLSGEDYAKPSGFKPVE